MSKFSDELTRLMNENDINDEELSERLNVSRTTVTRWRSGIRSPKMDKLSQIASIFHTDPRIFVGELAHPAADILPIYNQLERPRQQKVYNFASNQLAEQNNPTEDNTSPNDDNMINFSSKIDESKSNYQIDQDLDIYGAASAGPGEVLMDEHVENISYHGFIPEHDYALVVNGNSMEPLFADQQIIFVSKTDEAYSGQIVIAYLNGNAYVKKLWLGNDKCELISLNPNYDPIEIGEFDDFRIDGVVIL